MKEFVIYIIFLSSGFALGFVWLSIYLDWSMIDERLPNNFKTRQQFRQRNRRCNDIVQAMYAMYCTGKSLADIGKIYRKTRQTVYDQFRVRGFILRSKRLQGLTLIDGYVFTVTKGGYLRGTVNGRRMLAHHYVWERHNEPVPLGYCIRHINGIKNDPRIENLEIMSKSEFSSRYGPRVNQFTSPRGSRRKKGERIRLEREERYRRAMLIWYNQYVWGLAPGGNGMILRTRLSGFGGKYLLVSFLCFFPSMEGVPPDASL